MVLTLRPLRRVITGNDAQGRSIIVHDGPSPHQRTTVADPNRGHTLLWIYDEAPLPMSGTNDDGGLPYVFPGTAEGGHFRIVEAAARPAGGGHAGDPGHVKSHEPKTREGGRAWDRGDKGAYTSAMHKTQSIDYGIMLDGERDLTLDDGTVTMKPGDIVVQVGSWHKWTAEKGCLMAFDLVAADFRGDINGVAEAEPPVVKPDPNFKYPEGVEPVRRIVTIDREAGRSSLVSDGPAPDIRLDPARPGYATTRLWVTDSMPAKLVTETLHLPHTIEPPPRGTICRVVTYPPDSAWQGKVGAAEVAAFFRSMGSPGASTYSPSAPHPYMQKTKSLDFCIVLDGEITLVLDTGETTLEKGDIVIQRGTNHAFSNRSSKPARIVISSHDGTFDA